MKIQNPKTFMGAPVEGAIERALKEEAAQALTKPEPQPLIAPALQDYIFVPSLNLYLAKQRTHQGLNWYQTHETLSSENLRMPTIPEFKEFIKYLKNGYPDRNEAQAILDDILTVRNPWRTEWFDARFEKINGKMYINYLHKISGTNIIDKKSELLEDCLMQDKAPGIDLDYWINNATKQGLPPANNPSGSLYYCYPMENNVARFSADSGRASLGCSGFPGNGSPSLGVRCVARTSDKT